MSQNHALFVSGELNLSDSAEEAVSSPNQAHDLSQMANQAAFEQLTGRSKFKARPQVRRYFGDLGPDQTDLTARPLTLINQNSQGEQ